MISRSGQDGRCSQSQERGKDNSWLPPWISRLRATGFKYLQSNKPRDNEELPVYLPDIMETWQSGAQANNEPIMSAAAIVLDLLLQFLSRSLATVPYGIGLCRTLLRRQQQELIARNLSVDKGKTFIICPTLRMLREAICFDGGVVAKPIFRARGNTFKSLARNMGIRYTGEGTEDRQRTSARTTAVRLYLCALKYLHVEAKQELLSQRDMVAALTRNLQHDPAFLVLEILQGLKQYVLQDDQISRDARRKLLNGFTLSNIATLYNFSNAGNDRIRKEALTNILRMALKIQQSEYDEKEQIWLLLSEVAETAKEMVDSGPLPSPLVAFAYHALDVLKNPLHCLYPKTNQFLTRAPLWDPDKVPLVQEIVQEEPKGNSFYAQVGWLATYALSCLRNPGDVDLFRRKRAFGPIFERIFALAGVPYMQAPLRRQLLRIIYRVTETDGSSSTLTTRFGIIAWLKAQAAMCKDEKEAQVYEALVQRMARNGDRERISRWSKGGIEVLDWMGPPPENHRNQPKNSSDRGKTGDGLVPNQENRRPALDRSGSRNIANPEDIILGPPRMAFASSTLRTGRPRDADGAARDPDRQDRSDRFNYRNRTSDSENPVGDKFRDSRDTKAGPVRRRGDQEQDSDGWSTVKPRKSFGHEGAERFQSRMGGTDRFGTRDHQRVRERDERDGEGRRRNLEHVARDKDGDEAFEAPRRSGLNRGRSEPWFRDGKDEAAPSQMSQRERIDRNKNWRERESEDRSHEKNGDRYGGDRERPFDRKWDRDREQRVEREPEWLDEPAEEKAQAHTMEDFQKFMESMKKSKAGPAEPDEPTAGPATRRENHSVDAANEADLKVASAPPVESGPDKFFMAFGGGSLDGKKQSAELKEAAKAKAGKPSSNKEFLMMLMQSNRSAREPPQRTVNVNEQLVMQMPQPTKAVNLPNLPQGPDLGLDYPRDHMPTQRQLRGQGMPSFMDEQFHGPEPVESRAQGPPTQILQRANMGGLDHHMHPYQMGLGGQQQLPPQRPMIPPPGLSNAPRNLTMAQPINGQQQLLNQQLSQQLNQQAGMFTPNFAPSGFPPEALLAPHSARAMPPPPPGFFGGPPPGFVPPGMLGFQGHEGHVFPGGPLPFDRRGMLPPGAGAYRGP
ncbi:hypothetical protein P8C59_000770 [Phyllachora maydis]|uniref:URB1 N-terminal domain-containing protein n=1 Tax=Phyllachora maydis TaxID=1825666 RepID=A0AAD9HWT6_9PEZI|nr:hypothetical protein P8C59_000770 [Phyllachora maydis]